MISPTLQNAWHAQNENIFFRYLRLRWTWSLTWNRTCWFFSVRFYILCWINHTFVIYVFMYQVHPYGIFALSYRQYVYSRPGLIILLFNGNKRYDLTNIFSQMPAMAKVSKFYFFEHMQWTCHSLSYNVLMERTVKSVIRPNRWSEWPHACFNLNLFCNILVHKNN